MSNNEIIKIFETHKNSGWLPEPEAMRIFGLAKLNVPKFIWAKTADEAVGFAEKISYPVVAKIVSSSIIHKSDVGGVIVGINTPEELKEAYRKLSRIKDFQGVIVEQTLKGRELIIGAKVDFQFGPIVLLGLGGTGVEIYQDVSMRMAPLKESDVLSMIESLKGKRIITGFRGSESVNIKSLTDLIVRFSSLIMDIENYIDSIDMNPVMCSTEQCMIADARIMLKA